jgi:flagellar biosynthesis component FlhA
VRVLRALVDEMVPINAFDPLCTAFLEKARQGANLDEILRTLRSLPEIRPFIPGNNREGRFLALSAAIEEQIANGLQEHGDEFLLAIRPEATQKILSAVRTKVGSAPRTAASALVVKNPLIRRYVRRLTELEFPALPVLSSTELDAGAEGKVMQTIELS